MRHSCKNGLVGASALGRGFTLIEVMIVVAIVAILATLLASLQRLHTPGAVAGGVCSSCGLSRQVGAVFSGQQELWRNSRYCLRNWSKHQLEHICSDRCEILYLCLCNLKYRAKLYGHCYRKWRATTGYDYSIDETGTKRTTTFKGAA